MIFSVRQKLVQEYFLSESQDLESKLYLLNFSRYFPCTISFQHLLLFRIFVLEIALPPLPHSHLT